MKNLKKSTFKYLILAIGFLIVSCKQNTEANKKNQEVVKEETVTPKNEIAKLMIEDYFSGANFMRVIANKENGLNLTEEQNNVFNSWMSENHVKVQKIMKNISDLELEIVTLSKNKANVDQLLDKVKEAGKLRKDIATIKLECRDHIIRTLKDDQWAKLITSYGENYPFVEKTEMLDVITHVNPVPNYMQAINTNSEELNITDSQSKKISQWSNTHHPKMMEKASKIITLEKEINEASVLKTSKDKILEKVNAIEQIRVGIVTTKTNCRDEVSKILTDDQWNALIEKMM